MLTANHLSKIHQGKRIVKDFSIILNKKEIVGLLGPNGAGKTTAFYMLAGIVKADIGCIMLDNQNITNMPLYMRARKGLGYLPQESSIFKELSVEDNIMCILERIEPDSEARHRRLLSILEEFSITHLHSAYAITLSGGERRRVEIARSMASNPAYLMLDEPFAGVDPISIGEIKEIIIKLKNKGIGILITDHNIKEVINLMDKLYVMHDGHVLDSGPTQKVINNPQVKKLYLGESFHYESSAQ